jgi:rod shape-determining protein MreB
MLNDVQGNYLIINIQENSTKIAVLSDQKYVYSAEHLEGTLDIDRLIISFFAREFNLQIGFRTAQSLRTEIGSAVEQQTVSEIKVRGRVTGFQTSSVRIQEVIVSNGQIRKAISSFLTNLAKEVSSVVKQCNLLNDTTSGDSKIFLRGEGSTLNGLDKWLQRETGLPVILAYEQVTFRKTL